MTCRCIQCGEAEGEGMEGRVGEEGGHTYVW